MLATKHRNFQAVCWFGLFLLVANVLLTQASGWARLASGLGMYALLFGFIWVMGFTRADLGLEPDRMRRGLVLGLRVSMLVAAVLLVAFLVSPETFQDERYHQSIWLALVFALCVLPFETVLFEELVFRGVVWGFVRKAKNARVATQVSSALFGLWHIAPSLAINATAIAVGGISIRRGLLIVGIVLITYGAGVLLCELRRRSDSLLAPILVHWTINGFAVLLAAFAWAR